MEPQLLNFKRKDISGDESFEAKLENNMNIFINKVDNAIGNFRFNVAVALFYEIYNYLKNLIDSKVSNKVLSENIIKVMKVMLPFTRILPTSVLNYSNAMTLINGQK